MIGQIAGMNHSRPGFCVAGRGTTAMAMTIYVPGFASSTTRRARATLSGSVVPGLSRSLNFVFVLCENIFSLIFFGELWIIYQ